MKRRTIHFATQILLALFVFAGLLPYAFAQADSQGQWTTLPYTMPINPVHVALLHNGKVLIVSGSGNLAGNTNMQAGIWDPQSGKFTTQTVVSDMFCNGMTALSDGRILINGGTKLLSYDPFLGRPDSTIYDPTTNIFTAVEPNKHGRWYPTLTMLPDGRIMTFSGLNETDGGTNNAVEIYTVGSGWGPESVAPWSPPLYPRMHLLPNGKVFYSGPSAHSSLFDPATQTWAVGIADTKSGFYRLYGSSVLLPLTPANNYDPKVMILGGGTPSISGTEIIDLNAPTPTWQLGPSMSQPRIEMDAILLPNQKVLAVGGSYTDEDPSSASLNADLYDPAANSFSSAGANVFPRLYHTTSILLPDATVWLAGGNPGDIYEQHIEIYKPAYLFTTDGHGGVVPAVRPSITSAPAATTWQGSFTVQTPDASDISSVVLVRPGSSTHAFDMDQRLVGLAFTRGSQVLNVTAPPNANIAPPGYYMVFILNSAGVPSIAKFIQLGTSSDFSLSTTPASSTVLKGSSATYTVNVTPFAASAGTVNLSVTGLPVGVTGTFSPGSVVGSGSSTLTISTLSSTPVGTYVPTITATNGSVSNVVTLSLTVNVQTSAAFGIDTIATGDNSAAATNLITSAFSTSGPNELLLAFVSTDGPNSGPINVSTVNGGGLTWERVQQANAQPGDAEIWRAFAFAPLSGVNVTVGMSPFIVGSSVTVVAFTGTDLSGTNGSGAIGATGSFNAAIGAPSGSLVTTRNNSWVFGVGNDWDRAVARTVGAGQTLVHQLLASVGSTYWVQRQTNVTPLSGTSVTINDTAPTNDKFNLSLVEVLPAAGGNLDFSVSANPSSQTVVAGASTQYTTTITGQSGFSGTVNLGVSGLPAGVSGTFNPTSVAGSGSSTLTITTPGSTAPGSYPFTITATSGSLSHNTGATLVVTGSADFSILASPSSQTVVAGSGTTYTATITGQNGFSGTANLSVTGLPTGVTGTFNPTSVTGSGSSILTIATAGATATGSYTLTLTATSGSSTHSTTVILVVSGPADFSVVASPGSQTVVAGFGTSYTTTVSSVNGFSGTVTLGVSGLPAGATGTFNPTTIAGSGSSTLTITTLGTTPAGTSTLTISGTLGSLIHSTTVGLTVTTSPPPGQLAIDTFTSTDRTTAATSVTSPAFSTAAPNELLLAFVSADSASSGGLTVSSVTGGGLTWVLVKRTNAQPGGAEIWRAFATTALSNATVTANLSQNVVSSITVVAFSGTDMTGTNGSGAIGAIGGGSAAAGAPTASLITTRNNSWVFGVGVDWDNAVARTLGANQTLLHQYLTPVKSTYWVQRQTSVTPLSGTTVTINDTAPTTDKFDLSLVEILPAVGSNPDFSVAANPPSQTVLQGSGTTYTVNVAGAGGFSGTVTLGVNGLPAGATGTFNPTTIAGSGSSTLTITTLGTTPAGTSTLTISGVSGSLNHSTTVGFTVNTATPPGQLAIDTLTSTDRTTAATSVTSPAFSTAAPNELLLAFISADSSASGGLTASSVTGGGLTWVLVKRTNAQPGGTEIWRAFATTALSNATVTANLSQNVVSSITVVAFSGTDTTGTNGSGAIGATGGGSAASGAPTASLVTTRNNSWVFGVGTDWDHSVARTLGANQTLVHQYLTPVNSTYWVQRQTSVTPLSGTTVTINDTAPTTDKFDLSIVEILGQ